MPIAVPMTSCHSYSSSSLQYAAPYVPVSYGGIVSPTFAHPSSLSGAPMGSMPVPAAALINRQVQRPVGLSAHRDLHAKEEQKPKAIQAKLSKPKYGKNSKNKVCKSRVREAKRDVAKCAKQEKCVKLESSATPEQQEDSAAVAHVLLSLRST